MRREVVVVLPYAGGRVLMHLRDRNAKYNPEMWGFFSGGVEPGETPMECALREIEEEINLKPAAIHKLDSRQSEDLTHVVSHAFYCALDVPLDSLILREGLDSGLFTVEEIESGQLYSGKFKRPFPVAPFRYIPNTVKRLFKRLE